MSVSDLLFPNQYRRKVLALMLMNPHKWVHLRELARLTNASPGTLKKELDALVTSGLLKLQKVGNQSQFSSNTDHPVFPELSALIRKTIGLQDVLVNALQTVAADIEVAFVFGSMAKATDTSHSDVDLLIIGNATFGHVVNALFESQATLGREINPKVMTRKEWLAKKMEHNAFVGEIAKQPKLFLIGTEHDL